MQVSTSSITTIYLESYNGDQVNKDEYLLTDCSYFTTIQEDKNIYLFHKLGVIDSRGHVKENYLKQITLPKIGVNSLIDDHNAVFIVKGFYEDFPLNISLSKKELFTILNKEFPNINITYGGSSLFDHLSIEYVKNCFTLFFELVNFRCDVETIIPPFFKSLLIEKNRDQDFSILPPEPYPFYAYLIAKRITTFLANKLDIKKINHEKLLEHLSKKLTIPQMTSNNTLYEKLIDNSGFCKFENPDPNALGFKNSCYIRSLSDRKVTPLIIDLFIKGNDITVKGLFGSNALYVELDELYKENCSFLTLQNDLCHPFQSLFDNITQLMTTYNLSCSNHAEFLRYISELVFLKRSWEEGLFKKLFDFIIKDWKLNLEQFLVEHAFKQVKTHHHSELNQWIAWTFTFCSFFIAYDNSFAPRISKIWQDFFALVDNKGRALKLEESPYWINYLQIALRSFCDFEEILAIFQISSYIATKANLKIANHSIHITQTDHPGLEKVSPTYQIRVYPKANHKIFAFVLPVDTKTALEKLLKISSDHLEIYDNIFTNLLPLDLTFSKTSPSLFTSIPSNVINEFLDQPNFLVKKIGYFLALTNLQQNLDWDLTWRLIVDCYIEKKLTFPKLSSLFFSIDHFFTNNLFLSKKTKIPYENSLNTLCYLISNTPIQLHPNILSYLKTVFFDLNLNNPETVKKIYKLFLQYNRPLSEQWLDYLLETKIDFDTSFALIYTTFINKNTSSYCKYFEWILKTIQYENLSLSPSVKAEILPIENIHFFESNLDLKPNNISNYLFILLYCQKRNLLDANTIKKLLNEKVDKLFITNCDANLLLDLWMNLKKVYLWDSLEKEIKIVLLQKLNNNRILKGSLTFNTDEFFEKILLLEEEQLLYELHLIYFLDSKKVKPQFKPDFFEKVLAKFKSIDNIQLIRQLFQFINYLIDSSDIKEKIEYLFLINTQIKQSNSIFYPYHINLLFQLWYLIKKDNNLFLYKNFLTLGAKLLDLYPEKKEDIIKKFIPIISSSLKLDKNFVFTLLNDKEILKKIFLFCHGDGYKNLIVLLKENVELFFEESINLLYFLIINTSENNLIATLESCLFIFSKIPKKFTVKKLSSIVEFIIKHQVIVKKIDNHKVQIKSFLYFLEQSINKHSIIYYNSLWHSFEIPFEIEWMEKAQSFLARKLTLENFNLAKDLLTYSPTVNCDLLYSLVKVTSKIKIEDSLHFLLKFNKFQITGFNEQKYNETWELILEHYRTFYSKFILQSFLENKVFFDLYKNLNLNGRLKCFIILTNSYLNYKDNAKVTHDLIRLAEEDEFYSDLQTKSKKDSLIFLAYSKLMQVKGSKTEAAPFKEYIKFLTTEQNVLFKDKNEWKVCIKICLSNPLFWENTYVEEQKQIFTFIIKNIACPAICSNFIKTLEKKPENLEELLLTTLKSVIKTSHMDYQEFKEIFQSINVAVLKQALTYKLNTFSEEQKQIKKSITLEQVFLTMEQIHDFIMRGDDNLKDFILKTAVNFPSNSRCRQISKYLLSKMLKNDQNVSKLQYLKNSSFLQSLPEKEQKKIKKFLSKNSAINLQDPKLKYLLWFKYYSLLLAIAVMALSYSKGQGIVTSFGFIGFIFFACFFNPIVYK